MRGESHDALPQRPPRLGVLCDRFGIGPFLVSLRISASSIHLLYFLELTNSGAFPRDQCPLLSVNYKLRGEGVVWRLDATDWSGRREEGAIGGSMIAPKPGKKRPIRPHFLTNSRGFAMRSPAAQPQGTLHLRSRSADWIPQSDSVECRRLRNRRKCCAPAGNFQRADLRGGSTP